MVPNLPSHSHFVDVIMDIGINSNYILLIDAHCTLSLHPQPLYLHTPQLVSPEGLHLFFFVRS
jgi:hypothetical protein